MQKRILVVDDDTMNLVRTKMILENDYEVLLADSGIKALDKIKGEPVDLVLLDIEMPKLNGIETAPSQFQAARRRKITIWKRY